MWHAHAISIRAQEKRTQALDKSEMKCVLFSLASASLLLFCGSGLLLLSGSFPQTHWVLITFVFSPAAIHINSFSPIVATWRRLYRFKPLRIENSPSLVALCLLLLCAENVEVNPSPKQWRYPCGVCLAPIKCNQRSVQCNTCIPTSFRPTVSLVLDQDHPHKKLSFQRQTAGISYYPVTVKWLLFFIDVK